jgi:hypothetical protein
VSAAELQIESFAEYLLSWRLGGAGLGAWRRATMGAL